MVRRNYWPVVLAAGIAAGCSRGPAVPGAADYDSAAAKRALTDALEAWKAGRPEALATRTPPVRFTDDDRAAGWQLVEYRLRTPDAPIRRLEAVPVDLKLRDRRGRTAERAAWYQVALTPAQAVIRSDP